MPLSLHIDPVQQASSRIIQLWQLEAFITFSLFLIQFLISVWYNLNPC